MNIDHDTRYDAAKAEQDQQDREQVEEAIDYERQYQHHLNEKRTMVVTIHCHREQATPAWVDAKRQVFSEYGLRLVGGRMNKRTFTIVAVSATEVPQYAA